MSRSRNLKLAKLANHEHQPHISIVGHGENTFLWVGDQKCYSYSSHGQKELYKFAEALIRRLMKPYLPTTKEIKIKL